LSMKLFRMRVRTNYQVLLEEASLQARDRLFVSPFSNK